MNKKHIGKLAVLCLILLSLCGAIKVGMESSFTAGWLQSTKAQDLAPAVDMDKKVNTLWVLADLIGGRHLPTTITVQGSFGTTAAHFEQAREEWKKTIQVNASFKAVTEHGREVFRLHYQGLGWESRVLMFFEQDGKAYYTVTIEGASDGGRKGAIEEAERLYMMLKEAEYAVDWNAAVRAEAALDLKEAWSKAEQAIQEMGEALPLDRYEDDRTISVSYHVSYMGQGVKMKDSTVNLQVAAHENGETGLTKVTFGTPLIAGEY